MSENLTSLLRNVLTVCVYTHIHTTTRYPTSTASAQSPCTHAVPTHLLALALPLMIAFRQFNELSIHLVGHQPVYIIVACVVPHLQTLPLLFHLCVPTRELVLERVCTGFKPVRTE